jgi:hypothetical protein
MWLSCCGVILNTMKIESGIQNSVLLGHGDVYSQKMEKYEDCKNMQSNFMLGTQEITRELSQTFSCIIVYQIRLQKYSD